jgi:hypothetical protein
MSGVSRETQGMPHPLAFMEEALFFPLAPDDDLIDACARMYDMQPVPASKWERAEWEPPVHRMRRARDLPCR